MAMSEKCRLRYGTLTPAEKIECHEQAILHAMDAVARRCSQPPGCNSAPPIYKGNVEAQFVRMNDLYREVYQVGFGGELEKQGTIKRGV